MRTVTSSWDRADVEDKELADLISEALEAERPDRSTESTDEYGQVSSSVSLTSYQLPETEARWAVRYSNDQGEEILDSADRDAAEAKYEATVRELAACTGEHDEPWWETSDVTGIPLSAYTLTIELQSAGAWKTPAPHGKQDEDKVLGRADEDAFGDERPTSLHGALLAALAHVGERQQEANELEALHVAAGYAPGREGTADAVRVSVSGTEEAGEVTYTQTRTMEPVAAPTPQEIAEYRAAMESAATEYEADWDDDPEDMTYS